jgi:hypothetical protein
MPANLLVVKRKSDNDSRRFGLAATSGHVSVVANFLPTTIIDEIVPMF